MLGKDSVFTQMHVLAVLCVSFKSSALSLRVNNAEGYTGCCVSHSRLDWHYVNASRGQQQGHKLDLVLCVRACVNEYTRPVRMSLLLALKRSPFFFFFFPSVCLSFFPPPFNQYYQVFSIIQARRLSPYLFVTGSKSKSSVGLRITNKDFSLSAEIFLAFIASVAFATPKAIAEVKQQLTQVQ